MTDRCDLQVTDYRVLFDDDRYPASGCAVVRSGDRLMMTVQRASDAERGISSLLTQSDDLGATWTEPHPGAATHQPRDRVPGHRPSVRPHGACGETEMIDSPVAYSLSSSDS